MPSLSFSTRAGPDATYTHTMQYALTTLQVVFSADWLDTATVRCVTSLTKQARLLAVFIK